MRRKTAWFWTSRLLSILVLSGLLLAGTGGRSESTAHAATLPDLVITSLTLSPNPADTNDDVRARVTVENDGGTAAGQFWIDAYINSSPSGCQDWGPYYTLASGLAAGASGYWDIILPAGFSIGKTEVRAYADSGCDIAEIHDDNNISGSTSMTVSSPPSPPSNDNFRGAAKVTSTNFSSSVDVSGATRGLGDPFVPGCELDPGMRSVWYTYTPFVNTTLALDTFGSNYDTTIAVWSGTSLSTLTPVACNDDQGFAFGGIHSALKVDLTALTTYYFEVAQYSDLGYSYSPLTPAAITTQRPSASQAQSTTSTSKPLPATQPTAPKINGPDLSGGYDGQSSYSLNFHARLLETTSGQYDLTDPVWRFTGTWVNTAVGGLYGGTLHMGMTVGGTATFVFTGNGFSFDYLTVPGWGKIGVYLDGSTTPLTTINTNAAANLLTYTSPLLANSIHAVTLKNDGGGTIGIDSITIAQPTYLGAGIYDGSLASWKYYGAWVNVSIPGPLLNNLEVGAFPTPGAVGAFYFNGTSFTLSYLTYPTWGNIQVVVDGKPETTLITSAPASLTSYNSATYTAGPHTVELVHNGPSGKFIAFDYIQIFP